VAARLPGQCDPAWARRKPIIATLTLSQRNSGPMILAGDQSLFTNGMLWHGDNAILAINVSRMLCEGQRSRLLFVADGAVLGSYEDSPLLKNPPARAPYYWRIILFVLAIMALAFVIWRISATGFTPQQPMPNRAMKTAQDLSSGRKIKSAEFGFASSLLARELCRELTGLEDPAGWRRVLSADPTTETLIAQEMSTRNQLSVVLDLAVNTRTVHISRRRFESIGQTIDQLRLLHRQGELLNPSGPVTDTSSRSKQKMGTGH
jgi:hypothetical protein